MSCSGSTTQWILCARTCCDCLPCAPWHCSELLVRTTSLHCWHASQNSSSVIVYQSSWCSPISPRYCWWPLICYSWSQDLEHSPSWCYYFNIAIVISSKTDDTLISAVISWHCCV